MEYAISPEDLKRLLDEKVPVKILDVRLSEDRAPVEHPIPGAVWRDPELVAKWQEEVDGRDIVVVYCVHGLRVSQGVCAALRERGAHARYLAGGIEAWNDYMRCREA